MVSIITAPVLIQNPAYYCSFINKYSLRYKGAGAERHRGGSEQAAGLDSRARGEAAERDTQRYALQRRLGGARAAAFHCASTPHGETNGYAWRRHFPSAVKASRRLPAIVRRLLDNLEH